MRPGKLVTYAFLIIGCAREPGSDNGSADTVTRGLLPSGTTTQTVSSKFDSTQLARETEPRSTAITTVYRAGTVHGGVVAIPGTPHQYNVKWHRFGVNFPTPIPGIRTLVATVQNSKSPFPQDYQDVFAVVVYDITSTGFAAQITRVDELHGGWRQQLYLNWVAVSD